MCLCSGHGWTRTSNDEWTWMMNQWNWNENYYYCINNNLWLLFMFVVVQDILLVHLMLNGSCGLLVPPPLMSCLPHNFLVVMCAFLGALINFQLKKLHRQFTDLPLWLIPLLNYSELSKCWCVVRCKIKSRKIWWPLKWLRHSVTRETCTGQWTEISKCVLSHKTTTPSWQDHHTLP